MLVLGFAHSVNTAELEILRPIEHNITSTAILLSVVGMGVLCAFCCCSILLEDFSRKQAAASMATGSDSTEVRVRAKLPQLELNRRSLDTTRR